MKLARLALAALLFAAFLPAQVINISPVDPQGPCSVGFWVNQNGGALWVCNNTVWNKAGTPIATGLLTPLNTTPTGSGAVVLATSPTIAAPTLSGTTALATATVSAAVTPSTAAGIGLGTAALPWSNLIVGTAATNVATITPATMSAARAITLADPGGAATIAYTNPTTSQALSGLGNLSTATAGTGTVGTAANTYSSLFIGTAATNNINLVGQTQAAARTYNFPDYGLSTQQIPGTVFLTGSAYTNATTTPSNITGLAFPVAASTNYTATCRLTWQGSASTTGPKWTFTGPASPTNVNIGAVSAVTATTLTQGVSTAFGTTVNNAGTITTATNFTDTVTLQLLNGANAGTVQLQAAANGAGTLTVQPGSWCVAQ